MKTIQLKLIAVLILTLLWCADAYGSFDEGLVINATVTSLEGKCDGGKLYFVFNLYIQVQNRSEETAIFARPDKVFEVRMLDWTGPGSKALTSGAATRLLREPLKPKSVYSLDFEWEGRPDPNVYREVLSSSILNRNSNGISVIEPRQYFEYHEVLYLENDPSIVPYARDQDEAVCIDRNSHSLSKPSSKDTPRLGDGQFKIEYRLSLKKFKNGEDVIAGIKKNLGAVGRLPLNSAGEIVYRTEDIILVQ